MNFGVELDLDFKVEKPPMLLYRNGGRSVAEPQLLVGVVDYSLSGLPMHVQARHLRDLGLYLDLAICDEESGRWEQVLFSEPVADMLTNLADAGQLPFTFEAGPSRGGLQWIQSPMPGGDRRPMLPLREYVLPAPVEDLDLMAIEVTDMNGTHARKRARRS
jgi:hypothetical protein